MRYWAGVLLVLASACSDEQPVATNQTTAVALIATTPGRTHLAFAAEAMQPRLGEVIAGLRPRDFQWVMITIDSAIYGQVKSPQGLRLDFRTPSSSSFEQVYVGPCNPATQDYNNCLLYENVAAGEAGVTGNLNLRLHSRFEADYDITSEGQTDRFGEPIQWHKHQSLGAIVANLAQVPQ